MKLIEFTNIGGNSVYINPQQIVAVDQSEHGTRIATNAIFNGASMIFVVSEPLKDVVDKIEA